MTREEAFKTIVILKAYANGEQLQYLRVDGKWCDMEPGEVISLSPDINKIYRIKPTPEYRPHDMMSFTRAWSDSHKGSTIRLRGCTFSMAVEDISQKSVCMKSEFKQVTASYTYLELCDSFVWTDTNTPVGVEIPLDE